MASQLFSKSDKAESTLKEAVVSGLPRSLSSTLKLQVASWGGYSFIVNLLPIHCLACIFTGRLSSKLYVAYAPFVIIGTIEAGSALHPKHPLLYRAQNWDNNILSPLPPLELYLALSDQSC